MASRLAPRGQLEAPREATGEQFALLEAQGACREVGGFSHRAGLGGKLGECFVHMTDRKPRTLEAD